MVILYQDSSFSVQLFLLICFADLAESESLTERRKKLYGAINRFRKSIKWKFIWSQNGWIYVRKDKTAKKLLVFDHEEDLGE